MNTFPRFDVGPFVITNSAGASAVAARDGMLGVGDIDRMADAFTADNDVTASAWQGPGSSRCGGQGCWSVEQTIPRYLHRSLRHDERGEGADGEVTQPSPPYPAASASIASVARL